jgi:NAD(P)-dependent dehydrogenase (short-subunit alcohol dehydrogenase family)
MEALGEPRSAPAAPGRPRTAFVCGGSSGLGFAAARLLVESGEWKKVYVSSRSAERAAAAARRILDAAGAPPGAVEPVVVDCCDHASIVALCDRLVASGVRLHLLLLSSGQTYTERLTTSQGIEHTVAASLAGQHSLTVRLLRGGALAGGARIIIAGAEGARGDNRAALPYDFRAIAARSFGGDLERAIESYCRGEAPEKYSWVLRMVTTKLLVVHWVKGLAPRLPAGATVNAVSPGSALDTGAIEHVPLAFRLVFRLGGKWLMKALEVRVRLPRQLAHFLAGRRGPELAVDAAVERGGLEVLRGGGSPATAWTSARRPFRRAPRLLDHLNWTGGPGRRARAKRQPACVRNGPMRSAAAFFLLPAAAAAHHEAIFGPQSSLVLSAPGFVSFQSFSRQLGAAARTQETTALISAGITPFREAPLSLSFIAPASHIAEIDGAGFQLGPEDVIFGARYRLDFTWLQERSEREGNFLMAMAAAEFPTGTIDHPFLDGAFDFMAAALASVEWAAFSAIAYGFQRINGADRGGDKPGDSLFLGGGLAWTPWDDPANERLLSLQLGFSHEIYFRDRIAGAEDDASGGWAFLLHPTVVWGPGGHFLLFALVSLPVAQEFRDAGSTERWRAGVGAVYLFGH